MLRSDRLLVSNCKLQVSVADPCCSLFPRRTRILKNFKWTVYSEKGTRRRNKTLLHNTNKTTTQKIYFPKARVLPDVMKAFKSQWSCMYRQLHLQQFYVLPTQCICVFCVDLITNSDYFTVQHWLTGFYNRDGVCLLRRTLYILRSAHTVNKYLRILCGSENKQLLFHCTALTDWFV